MRLPSLRFSDFFMGVLFFVLAIAARYYYLSHYGFDANAPLAVWQVQGNEIIVDGEGNSETDLLVKNIKTEGLVAGFKTITPLSNKLPEITAHVSPGLAYFRYAVDTIGEYVPLKFTQPQFFRYVSILLGGLAVLFWVDSARLMFGGNVLVTALTGLGTALFPIWIINSGEVADGPLVVFLTAAVINLALRTAYQGGMFKATLLGLFLAALVLTRMGLFLFAIVVLLWFLWQSRKIHMGWFSAVLAWVCFFGALVPWSLRNMNQFNDFVPITTSAWFHLWVGNNAGADGGSYNWSMDKNLPEAVRNSLAGMNQAERYNALAEVVKEYVKQDPNAFVQHRLKAAVQFFAGSNRAHNVEVFRLGNNSAYPPGWLRMTVLGSLVALLLLAMLGWRWSYGWKSTTGLLAVALLTIPLPYILGHADALHGSRLPLDGVLILFAAAGLVGLVPGLNGQLFRGENANPN